MKNRKHIEVIYNQIFHLSNLISQFISDCRKLMDYLINYYILLSLFEDDNRPFNI